MNAEHEALFNHWSAHPITQLFVQHLRTKYLDSCIDAVNKRFEPDDLFMRVSLSNARAYEHLQSVIQSGEFLPAGDTAP